MKARQRVLREQLVGADVLAGRWRHDVVPDISKAQVQPISYTEAREIVARHDGLGMPAVAQFSYGIFFDGQLGGTVVFGSDYGENLGTWDRYGYSGKIIALVRGVRVHWAPENTSSRLIRAAMRLLPARYLVVTATVDAAVGEIGAVFQAAGFDYVGQMSVGTRLRVHDGERVISERQARRQFGTSAIADLESLGLTVERVPRRGRYFAFRGTQAEQKELRAAIADRIKPYPKRPTAEPGLVIKFAGRSERLVTKSIGFVRVRRRLLKGGSSAASFDLLRSVWVDGKPRHQFELTLGTQRSDRDPARFWQRAVARMVEHGLSAPQRRRLVAEMIRKGAPSPNAQHAE